jgi:predicted amidohydrolase
MQDVLQFLQQEDWAGALVCLASHASPTALSTWESTHNKARHTDAVSELVKRLQTDSQPSEQLTQQPLTLLSALDQLVAASSVRRFSGSPFVLPQGGSWWLIPVETPIRERAVMRQQMPRLDHYVEHHVVVPTQLGTHPDTVEVKVCVPTGTLAHGLREMARSTTPLKAWIAHYDDGCCVQWKRTPPSGRLTAVGLDDEPKRMATATLALDSAAQAGVHVVLAPELSLTPTQQSELVKLWVDQHQPEQPSLLALGSFHEAIDGLTHNVAKLTDGCTGDPLFVHHKLRVFGKYTAAEQPDDAEDIIVGDSVNLLVTALGNFTVLICKDFVDAHSLVHGLLQQLGADWVLVPSYGDDKNQKAQLERADEVSRIEVGCHVLVASLRNLGISAGAQLPGFWQPSDGSEPQHVSVHGGCVSIAVQRTNVVPLKPGIVARSKHS